MEILARNLCTESLSNVCVGVPKRLRVYEPETGLGGEDAGVEG